MTRSEALTEQFYQWEILGRGWHGFDRPVHLEPVFIPFFGHILPQSHDVDDGKRHTPISFVRESVRNFFAPKGQAAEATALPPYEPRAYYLEDDEPLSAFSISLPEGE